MVFDEQSGSVLQKPVNTAAISPRCLDDPSILRVIAVALDKSWTSVACSYLLRAEMWMRGNLGPDYF